MWREGNYWTHAEWMRGCPCPGKVQMATRPGPEGGCPVHRRKKTDKQLQPYHRGEERYLIRERGGEETNILTSFRNFCPDRSRTIRHSMGAKLGNFYQIEFLPNSHVVSDDAKKVRWRRHDHRLCDANAPEMKQLAFPGIRPIN